MFRPAIALLLSATPALAAPGDWPSYNNTVDGQRYATQAEITPANVAALRPVCTYGLGRQTSFQTGPVVIDGTIYITTDFDTIALDAGTCTQKWRTTETYKPAGPLNVNRGAAVLDGRVFRGTQDGRVLAYDATTGARLWATTIADAKLGETVPAALLAWHGLVFAGNAGGDNKGVKGRMYALDAATGRIVWEQYMVPREVNDVARGPAAPTPTRPDWHNMPGVPITGGASWTSYTLDPATGTLYFPGGSPAPDFAPQLRPGANPYAGSLVGLDAMTGAVRQVYRLVERDFHDWDVSAAPAVVTTRSGASIVLAAIKDGHLYAFDRSSASRRFKTATAAQLNTAAPMTAAGTRFCPGTQGGTEWNGPSYSPATNLAYVGAVDWCTTVRVAPATTILAVEPGQPWSGSSGGPAEAFGKLDPPGKWGGEVSAVDADSGRVAWRAKLPAPVLSGVTATAGGLVFAGDMRGTLYAFDAGTGANLWSADAGGALGGGIVSYASGGRQRIAVAAGMTSPIWPTRKVNARLVVYGLEPTSGR